MVVSVNFYHIIDLKHEPNLKGPARRGDDQGQEGDGGLPGLPVVKCPAGVVVSKAYLLVALPGPHHHHHHHHRGKEGKEEHGNEMRAMTASKCGV